jgi:hypothetical protein
VVSQNSCLWSFPKRLKCEFKMSSFILLTVTSTSHAISYEKYPSRQISEYSSKPLIAVYTFFLVDSPMQAPYACRSAPLAQPPGSCSANLHTLQTHSVSEKVQRSTNHHHNTRTKYGATEQQPRHPTHVITTYPFVYHSDSV